MADCAFYACSPASVCLECQYPFRIFSFNSAGCAPDCPDLDTPSDSFPQRDYLFLFSAFLFPARLFNTTSVLLGHLWLFWLIFCVFYTAAKLSLGSLRGSQFYCYISFVTLSLSAYLFFLAAHFAVPYLQRIAGNTPWELLA